MSATAKMPPTRSRNVLDRSDMAYFLPMAAFLLITETALFAPAFYPAFYVAKTALVVILLIHFWPKYTKISWNYWWLGIIFGVVGVVQWVGMENFLMHHWPSYPKLAAVDPFNPYGKISSEPTRVIFIAVRWAGASLVVPIMEELFWRDWVWRTTLAPNNFKLAEVGEPSLSVWLIVSVIFCLVHTQWMTAIVWAMMIGGLLMLTRSLGACILMHAVTNFLLGLYVLRHHAWYFW